MVGGRQKSLCALLGQGGALDPENAEPPGDDAARSQARGLQTDEKRFAAVGLCRCRTTRQPRAARLCDGGLAQRCAEENREPDRKSTRLNSSHIPLSRMP